MSVPAVNAKVAALTAAVLLVGGLAGALIDAASVQAAPTPSPGVEACVSNVYGTLRLIADPTGRPSQASGCDPAGEHQVDWDLAGAPGPAGPAGPPGAAGAPGVSGAAGRLDAATAQAADGSLAAVSVRLQALSAQLAAEQQEETAILGHQQQLAASLPDASHLAAELRTLVGANAARDLLAAGGHAARLARVKPAPAAADLGALQAQLRGQLDSMSEMSELTSLRLQMAMDRRSKFVEALSNIMKKLESTQQSIVDNLKG